MTISAERVDADAQDLRTLADAQERLVSPDPTRTFRSSNLTTSPRSTRGGHVATQEQREVLT